MSNIAAAPRGGKGWRRLDASPAHHLDAIPAPSFGLLALLKRPLPLGELRPAAIAAGMSMEVIEAAISVATRRGEMRIEADRDGTILAVRQRP
jgi:hypothetical protein